MARAQGYAAILDEEGDVQPNRLLQFFETDGVTPLGQALFDADVGGAPVVTPETDARGTFHYFTALPQRATVKIEDDDRLQPVDFVPDWSTIVLQGGRIGWADGTLSEPGGYFFNAPRNGVRRVTEAADEWALVAGGGLAGGGDAIRVRRGLKYPQVMIGQLSDAGGVGWTDPWGDSALKVHIVQEGIDRGHVIGGQFWVRNEAATRPDTSDPLLLPDSAAISCVIYQTSPTSNGAIRAVEAQTIRTAGNPHQNATAYGAEIGIHSSVAGNGTDKIGGIHLLSTETGEIDHIGVRSDVGIWIRGALGYYHGLRFQDETPLAQGILFDVDLIGLATIYGGIDISGPARRIRGQYGESVPAANRTHVQARTTNEVTRFGIIPNGASRVASVEAINASDATNASFGRLQASDAFIVLSSDRYGAGPYLPLHVQVAGASALSFATNGNLTQYKGEVWTGLIAPPAITAPFQPDFNPTGLATARLIYVSCDVNDRQLCGMVAQEAGRVITLVNTGGPRLVLAHENTTAELTAANRFNLGGATNLTLTTNEAVTLLYTGARWLQIGR